MKKIAIIFLLGITIVSCSKKQPELLTIKSDLIPDIDSILVFTPDDYKLTNNYPLVILLHGWSGNYGDWNKLTDVQLLSDSYNFIVATPDGFYDSWYLNSPLIANSQYENYFLSELFPKLLSDYSIDTTKVFITGLSMGGHGAMTLFLKHPNLFKSVGSTSGIVDITAFPENWGMKNKLGELNSNREIWEMNSALYILDSTSFINKTFILDCGTEDFAYDVNLDFAHKAKKLGFNFMFYSIPGDHTSKHWTKMIEKHFEFFHAQLKDH